MFDYSQNYKIARQAAAEGMVLLKNDDKTLPFISTDRISVIGEESLELLRGGGGSAEVLSIGHTSLIDGLNEKSSEGKLIFNRASAEMAKKKLVYSVAELNLLANETDKAIVVIKRNASEGVDRLLQKQPEIIGGETVATTGEVYESLDAIKSGAERRGYYLSHPFERRLFDNIEKSNIKEVVVVLNIAAPVDLSFLENYTKVKAILLASLPGVEGGRAIADILTGDINPSGKLTDTYALSYFDYPSSPYYNISKDFSEYKESIFVGYRHFETHAKDKVLYPFGFGLSYTSFRLNDHCLCIDNGTATLSISVTNTGEVNGKEVVQLYYSAPSGKLEKPALELGDYAKTKLLAPNESQTLTLTFSLDDMASFDEECASYILERGEYEFFVGNSIRNIQCVGKHTLNETKTVKSLSIQVTAPQSIEEKDTNTYPDSGIDKGITLYDVAEGKYSINEFVRQLSAEELIHLSQGQHCDFAKGTAGIGNMRKYKVPNPQTADGPAGLRKSVPTTHFPCPTLLASSFDRELVYSVGKALGYEGISTGVDILLAPGINIHRDPLCGRSFEYYSEDPYLTGKTAAAMINGIQSNGLLATIKHFFANSCELNRLNNNSIISERCAREIYLRGFEIAIKESRPAFVMSAYNLVNGTRSSANRNVLISILRKEWGYQGAVMTDWRCASHLWEEILAGNNIKMPCGYPDEGELALKKHNEGVLSRATLEENAICVLRAVMKTNRFKTKNFGITHKIYADKENTIDVLKTLGISSTRISTAERDGKKHLCSLTKDQRSYPTFVYYSVESDSDTDYLFSADIKTDCPDSSLWISVDDVLITKITCSAAENSQEWYTVSEKINIKEGEHILKIMVVTDPDEKFEYSNTIYASAEQFALDNIRLNGIN